MPKRLKPFLRAAFFASAVAASAQAAAQWDYSSYVEQGRSLGSRFTAQNDVATREQALEKNPDSLETRAWLLGYYAAHAMSANASSTREARLRNIAWLIENRPDSILLRNAAANLMPADFAPPNQADLERFQKLWRDQVQSHPGEPRILENAVKSLGVLDYPAVARYLRELRQLEPTNPEWAVRLGSVYASGMMNASVSTASASAKAFAEEAKNELDHASDVAVVGVAGQLLFGLGRMAGAPFASAGETYLKRAESLDPQNARWRQALAAPAPPRNGPVGGAISRVSLEVISSFREEDLWPGGVVPAMKVPAGAMHVDSAEQSKRLLIHPEPEFPPVAGTAGVQGIVRLGAVIGTNGHVEKLDVLSGNALLIPHALEAVRQWIYEPAVSGGNPVEVATEIDVKFTPPVQGAVLGGIIGSLPTAAPPPPPPPPRRDALPAGGVPTRIKIGGSVMQAQLVKHVSPVYPPLASQARIMGVVKLQAIIGKDGTVQDLQLISGHPLLVQAALDAVKQWTYKPTLINGQPVEVQTQIDVNFTLDQ